MILVCAAYMALINGRTHGDDMDHLHDMEMNSNICSVPAERTSVQEEMASWGRLCTWRKSFEFFS